MFCQIFFFKVVSVIGIIGYVFMILVYDLYDIYFFKDYMFSNSQKIKKILNYVDII